MFVGNGLILSKYNKDIICRKYKKSNAFLSINVSGSVQILCYQFFLLKPGGGVKHKNVYAILRTMVI